MVKGKTRGTPSRMAKGSPQKIASIALTVCAAVALQGCVAAAFPIVAGGLVGERQIAKANEEARAAEASVEVTGTGQELVNADLAPVGAEPISAQPPATPSRADFNAAFVETGSETAPTTRSTPPSASTIVSEPSAAGDQAEVAAANAVRPLPTPIPSAREALGPSAINQLLSYANSRQIASEEEPSAAMLSNRITLEPIKAQCGGVSPTILIDLDPEGSLFDPANATRPPSGLARGLAQLRLNGVSIAWISGNGVDKLDAVNRTLALTGLDINNEDRILLVRSPDDRKQTLREELSQISCLIAIAGDTRSDFDELYDYLKNPADADALEPLIGDGWFLIPQPLL